MFSLPLSRPSSFTPLSSFTLTSAIVLLVTFVFHPFLIWSASTQQPEWCVINKYEGQQPNNKAMVGQDVKQNGAATWKTLWEFFLHLYIFKHSSHDLVILLLGIYPSKMKMYSHKNLYVDVYYRLLFKSEKQRKNLETGILWYIYSIAYYSVIKRSKLWIHLTMWRNPNCIKLSERSQNEKLFTIWYHLYDILKRQNYRDSKKI